MKRNSKNFGINAACILAVITAGLVTIALVACMNPVNPSEAFHHEPPEGMGYVRLTINSSNVRAIRPTVGAFTHFALTFTDNATSIALPSESLPAAISGSTTGNIDLPPGEYTLEVIGYTAIGPAAKGAETTPFTVVEGTGSTPQSVTLAWIGAVPGEDGRFTYAITIPENSVTGAIMDIKAYPSSSLVSNVNLLTTANGSRISSGNPTIDAGYYYVDFTITAPSVNRFRQVLHVYQGLNSPFEHEFTNAHIIGGSGRLGMTITPPTTIDSTPPFGLAHGPGGTGTTVSEGDTITLALSGDTTVSLTGAYTGTQWLVSTNDFESPITTPTLPINAGTPPFALTGTYHVGVIGLNGGAPYSTFFYVEITP